MEQERCEALVAQNPGPPQEPDAGLPAENVGAVREPVLAEWSAEAPADSAGDPPPPWSELTRPADEPTQAAPEEPTPIGNEPSPWGDQWRAEVEATPSPNDALVRESPAPAAAIDEFRHEFPRDTLESPAAEPVQPDFAAAPEPSAVEPPSEFVPVSFIDRYRNLLEDDADAGFETGRRSLLDDEYLSPKQAAAHDDPVEDTDEALEAYMSNLMRRVRGDSPSGAATPVVDSRNKPLTAGLLVSEPAGAAPPPEPESPVEPFDLESIKRTPRRVLNLDLAALREIANVTARTAIAEHRQRRHVESVVTKVIISAMGVAAGAYALLAAPSFGSPWFWAGCAAATTSAGLAVQLVVVLRRRMNRRRRHLDPQAAAAAPMLQPQQIPTPDPTTENTEVTE
jgi:hypothetical protein